MNGDSPQAGSATGDTGEVLQRPSASRSRPLWAWFAYAAVSLPGLFYGYELGARLGGLLLGVAVAINGALFCSILASAAIEPLMRRRAARAAPRR